MENQHEQEEPHLTLGPPDYRGTARIGGVHFWRSPGHPSNLSSSVQVNGQQSADWYLAIETQLVKPHQRKKPL